MVKQQPSLKGELTSLGVTTGGLPEHYTPAVLRPPVNFPIYNLPPSPNWTPSRHAVRCRRSPRRVGGGTKRNGVRIERRAVRWTCEIWIGSYWWQMYVAGCMGADYCNAISLGLLDDQMRRDYPVWNVWLPCHVMRGHGPDRPPARLMRNRAWLVGALSLRFTAVRYLLLGQSTNRLLASNSAWGLSMRLKIVLLCLLNDMKTAVGLYAAVWYGMV